MTTQSFVPYRNCTIEVRVTPSKALNLGGVCRRFRVSWAVSFPGHPTREVASFPTQFDFLSEGAAFKYGEDRAHTFIDSVLAVSSSKAETDESLDPKDESTV